MNFSYFTPPFVAPQWLGYPPNPPKVFFLKNFGHKGGGQVPPKFGKNNPPKNRYFWSRNTIFSPSKYSLALFGPFQALFGSFLALIHAKRLFWPVRLSSTILRIFFAGRALPSLQQIILPFCLKELQNWAVLLPPCHLRRVCKFDPETPTWAKNGACVLNMVKNEPKKPYNGQKRAKIDDKWLKIVLSDQKYLLFCRIYFSSGKTI